MTLSLNTIKSAPISLQKAKWIWPGTFHYDLNNCYAQFRKIIFLSKIFKKAPVYITADNLYQLFVNGKFVSRGPARGFHGHWPYDEIDIGKYLNKGKNVIAIRAFHPGVSSPKAISAGMGGLLLGARWGSTEIITDLNWKCRREEGINRNTVPASSSLFAQEHIDLNMQDDAWQQLSYDDSSWQHPIKARVYNAMPWFALEPRSIPILNEQIIKPKKILGVSRGLSNQNNKQIRDVVAIRMSENCSHQKHTIKKYPKHIRTPKLQSKEFFSYLIDFEKTHVGNLNVLVKDANGNEIIDFIFTESIVAAHLEPIIKLPSWSHLAMGNRLICKNGNNKHIFFHQYGFRYLMIVIRNATSPLKIQYQLHQGLYPLERKGSFVSSDKSLNQIWEICAHTQQCCSIDAYVDTPSREQAQWWGDARVQGWNTFYLNGDSRLFRRGLHCIASQTTPDGLTYGLAPTSAHNCILPDFSLIWLITMWDYYWQTGSLEPFVIYQTQIKGVLRYFQNQMCQKFNLLRYDPRYWLFLDWSDLFSKGYSSIYNLWLLYALEKMSELYSLSGNRLEQKNLQKWCKQIKRSLEKLLNSNGCMVDGITFSGRKLTSCSIHAQTLSIMCKIKGSKINNMISNYLLPYLQGHLINVPTPSIYWDTYVYSVMADKGYQAEVIENIKRKWTSMIPHGSTYERIPLDLGESSLTHAWSAHPLYHLMQIIGGIKPNDKQWNKIIFEPYFYGKKAAIITPTPHGLILSKWSKLKNKTIVELSLPPKIEAKVKLPNLKIQSIKGKHQWII